jgi:mannose-6-phosphate isomerase
MAMSLYPLLFEPVCKEYLWGGDRIPRLRSPHSGDPAGICAESWEISDRSEGMSIVSNGHDKGRSLRQLVESRGADLLGTVAGSKAFPLLIKVIDAQQKLSIQVHPAKTAATPNGAEAKTEMWYVLAAEPDSCVFCGLMPGVTRATFEAALKTKKVGELLRRVPVKAGDVIFVPGGRVHAIAEGCLLLEVQQSSNTTYRVYDWDRVSKDGKPRELHIKEALEVINWKDNENAVVPLRNLSKDATASVDELLNCKFFNVVRTDLSGELVVRNDGRSFHALFVQADPIKIEANGITETVAPWTSCLIPAAIASYRMIPLTGRATAIRISVV